MTERFKNKLPTGVAGLDDVLGSGPGAQRAAPQTSHIPTLIRA